MSISACIPQNTGAPIHCMTYEVRQDYRIGLVINICMCCWGIYFKFFTHTSLHICAAPRTRMLGACIASWKVESRIITGCSMVWLFPRLGAPSIWIYKIFCINPKPWNNRVKHIYLHPEVTVLGRLHFLTLLKPHVHIAE